MYTVCAVAKLGNRFKVMFVSFFIFATGLLTHAAVTQVVNSGWVNVATAYKHK